MDTLPCAVALGRVRQTTTCVFAQYFLAGAVGDIHLQAVKTQKSVRYQDGYRGVDGARLNDIVEEPMAAIDSPSPPLYQRLTLDRDVEFPSGNDQCLFTCASCYKLPLCSLADFDRAETIGERMYLHFNKCFSVDGSGFCL